MFEVKTMVKLWNWTQPSGNVYTVESDVEKGTIVVTDKDGKQILKRENLTPFAIEIVEKNFMDIVAGVANEEEEISEYGFLSKKSTDYKGIYDSMMYT